MSGNTSETSCLDTTKTVAKAVGLVAAGVGVGAATGAMLGAAAYALGAGVLGAAGYSGYSAAVAASQGAVGTGMSCAFSGGAVTGLWSSRPHQTEESVKKNGLLTVAQGCISAVTHQPTTTVVLAGLACGGGLASPVIGAAIAGAMGASTMQVGKAYAAVNVGALVCSPVMSCIIGGAVCNKGMNDLETGSSTGEDVPLLTVQPR